MIDWFLLEIILEPAPSCPDRYALGLSHRPGNDALIIDAIEEGNAVVLINDYRLEVCLSHQWCPGVEASLGSSSCPV